MQVASLGNLKSFKLRIEEEVLSDNSLVLTRREGQERGEGGEGRVDEQ